MAQKNCIDCKWIIEDCWCAATPNRCNSCQTKYTNMLIDKMKSDAMERQKKIESWEITLINIWDIDPQYCKWCWLVHNWCTCKK